MFGAIGGRPTSTSSSRPAALPHRRRLQSARTPPWISTWTGPGPITSRSACRQVRSIVLYPGPHSFALVSRLNPREMTSAKRWVRGSGNGNPPHIKDGGTLEARKPTQRADVKITDKGSNIQKRQLRGTRTHTHTHTHTRARAISDIHRSLQIHEQFRLIYVSFNII